MHSYSWVLGFGDRKDTNSYPKEGQNELQNFSTSLAAVACTIKPFKAVMRVTGKLG